MNHMELESLSPEELNKSFSEGVCPEPQELIGEWRGIFLPFSNRSPLPFKELFYIILANTWRKVWRGKRIFIEVGGAEVKGINIVSALNIMKFDVRKVKSRLDSGEAIEFDYSRNIPPVSFIRDEVRAVKGDEKRRLIGVMFVELAKSRVGFPLMFFGLERL